MQTKDLLTLCAWVSQTVYQLVPFRPNLDLQQFDFDVFNEKLPKPLLRAWILRVLRAQSLHHKALVDEIFKLNVDLRDPYRAVGQIKIALQGEIKTIAEWATYFDDLPSRNKKTKHKDKMPFTHVEKIEENAVSAKRWWEGNCGECAALGFMILREYPKAGLPENGLPAVDDENISIEQLSLDKNYNLDHVFLLVNRNLEMSKDNIKDPFLWGEDAVICDIWVNKCFLVKDLLAGKIPNMLWLREVLCNGHFNFDNNNTTDKNKFYVAQTPAYSQRFIDRDTAMKSKKKPMKLWKSSPVRQPLPPRPPENFSLITAMKKKDDATTPEKQQLLYVAANEGDYDRVAALLNARANPALPDPEDIITPFCAAVRQNHFQIVNLFLQQMDTNPFLANELADGLSIAAYAGFAGSARIILDKMKAMGFLNKQILNEMVYWAAYQGKDEILELLLKYGADFTEPAQNGSYPLIAATKNGHLHTIELIYKTNNAINLNVRGKDKLTPLCLAALNGFPDIVKWLLKAGADENLAGNLVAEKMVTPLLAAAKNAHSKIVDVLWKTVGNLSNPQLNKLLYYCAAMGEDVRELLRMGAKPNEVHTHKKETPLTIAARYGHIAVVKVLLANADVEPNQKNGEGFTSLHFAAYHNNFALVDLLLKNVSVDPNPKDNDGYTPLHFAAYNGHLKMVGLLLANSKVDPNLEEKDGLTPLHTAAERGHVEVVKCLLADARVKPNLNKQTRHGYTPLHIAVENGHVEVVRFLLANLNVEPHRLNKEGKSALHTAASNGHVEIVKLLLANSDVNRPAQHGSNALHFAARQGHFEVVRLLLAHPDVIIDGKDSTGFTPLRLAKSQSNTDLAVFLDVIKDCRDRLKGRQDKRALEMCHQACLKATNGAMAEKTLKDFIVFESLADKLINSVTKNEKEVQKLKNNISTAYSHFLQGDVKNFKTIVANVRSIVEENNNNNNSETEIPLNKITFLNNLKEEVSDAKWNAGFFIKKPPGTIAALRKELAIEVNDKNKNFIYERVKSIVERIDFTKPKNRKPFVKNLYEKLQLNVELINEKVNYSQANKKR